MRVHRAGHPGALPRNAVYAYGQMLRGPRWACLVESVVLHACDGCNQFNTVLGRRARGLHRRDAALRVRHRAAGRISYSAPSGYHDDCAMALALANHQRWESEACGPMLPLGTGGRRRLGLGRREQVLTCV